MLNYIAYRLLLTIPTLLGAAVITFFLLRVIPGDVVAVKLTGDGAIVSQAVIDAERARLGLDKALIYQFSDWMLGLLQFVMGRSMWTGRPVIVEISQRFWT